MAMCISSNWVFLGNVCLDYLQFSDKLLRNNGLISHIDFIDILCLVTKRGNLSINSVSHLLLMLAGLQMVKAANTMYLD